MDTNFDIYEPRNTYGRTIESEYSIDHPLIINNLLEFINPKATQLFIKSVKQIQDGNEVKASTLFSEAIKEDPSIHPHAIAALLNYSRNCSQKDEGYIYYWLGIHSQYINEIEKAIIWYKKSIEAFRNIGFAKREGRAHCNLGTLLIRSKDPSGIEEYKKAIILNPLDGIAHICLGVARYASNDHDGALDAFTEAVSADPERYGPLVIIRLQILGDDWRDDVKSIALRMAKKHGINLENDNEREKYFQAGELVQQGNSLFQANHLEEALEIFEKGKVLFPNIPSMYLGISMVTMQYVELGKVISEQIPEYIKKAELNIKECIRLAPNDYEYIHAKEIIEEYKSKYHIE
jgi:tetratricopeptide (TPR) repeat protein